MRHIIIQAGGKGSRLEALTRNKPKALVPFDNLPIIFHLFAKFARAKFHIIADYKAEVLEKYLAIFAQNVDYKIYRARQKGTSAGICEVLENFNEREKFMLIWCDLILSNDFQLPRGFALSAEDSDDSRDLDSHESRILDSRDSRISHESTNRARERERERVIS